MLLFYDFEVFKHDWLVCILDYENRSWTTIVNDPGRLDEFYKTHSSHIWVAYNGRHYDQWILRSIVAGFNPYDLSRHIIDEGRQGFEFSDVLWSIPLIHYDTMVSGDESNPRGRVGLKTLEAYMGDSVEESSVSFNIDRELTAKEMEETIRYCRYDVEETVKVFFHRLASFRTSMSLINLFELPLKYISKTHAQIVAEILQGQGKDFDDEFSLDILPDLELGRYDYVRTWYESVFGSPHDYSARLDTQVAGVPTRFAFGGLHGSLRKYRDEGSYLLIDVTAYYPSLQLIHGIGSRNMGSWENFKSIHSENLRLKLEGDKVARQPFKVADNSISGQLKDIYSKIRDPRANNAICVNGQLILLDLIEKLEGACKLVMYNTDGILIKVRGQDRESRIIEIIKAFEVRTQLKFDVDRFVKVFIKDVNNYVLVDANGHVKSIGAYVKPLNDLDYDLPIVNEALHEYMVNNVPVARTINECEKLREFQKIYKLSRKYRTAWHRGRYLSGSTFRIFASSRLTDTFLGKQKIMGSPIEKFSNSPDKCFIDNGNIRDLPVPSHLDREYYIDLAERRLSQFLL